MDNVVTEFSTSSPAAPARDVRRTCTGIPSTSHRRGPTLPSHRLPRLPGQVAPPQQKSVPSSPARLEPFNSAPADSVVRALLTCCRSLRWAHRLADHRPYPDLDAFLAAADEAGYDLTPADLTEALAGESLALLPDSTSSATHAGPERGPRGLRKPIRARVRHLSGQLLPEESLDQVLAGIRSRLTNDPEERLVTAEELRRLARGRLTRLPWEQVVLDRPR